jgi:hypothetical protein
MPNLLDLFTKTYAPESLNLSESLPKRTDALQDRLLRNLEARSREGAELDRIREADSASMSDPLQALMAQVAPALLPGAPMWLRALSALPQNGEQTYLGGAVLGRPGATPAQSARRTLSEPERGEAASRMMNQVGKIAGGFRKTNPWMTPQDFEELKGHGYLSLVQVLEQALPDNPQALDAYLARSIRYSLSDEVKRMAKIAKQESGGSIDSSGGLRGLADEVEEAATRQVSNLGNVVGRRGIANPEAAANFSPEAQPDIAPAAELANAIKTLRSRKNPYPLESIGRDLFQRKLSPEAIQIINPEIQKIDIDKAYEALKHFSPISPAQELKQDFSPEEIEAAIHHVTKNSKSGRIRSFSNPARRYLIEDLNPLGIAKGLGYKESEFGDFNRRLQSVTKDVREILFSRSRQK